MPRPLTFLPPPQLLHPRFRSMSSHAAKMSTNPGSSTPTIPAHDFYSTYKGHPTSHLSALLSHLPSPKLILAGDSTLDNKYWLPLKSFHVPPKHYTRFLKPPQSRRDVAYWLNTLPSPFTTVNCAVEESTLRQRLNFLLPQDRLIVEHLSEEDVLVVSIGGNDIALRPSLGLAFAVVVATYLGDGWGKNALRKLFVDDMRTYIRELVRKKRPRLIVLCCLYFMDENADTASWANMTLRLLGYNVNPERVQDVIRRVGTMMKDEIKEVEGVRVVVADLFETLDGKDGRDYVARVEPSEQGGRKMAEFLMAIVQSEIDKK